MKCQKCNKEATVHVTDLVGGKPIQYHFCEEHAKAFLQNTQASLPGEANMASALATHLAQKMAFSKANSEFLESDQEMCPVCGIHFSEFRATSLFGCPEDYRIFSKQLKPLLMNIHGEIRHKGKAPKRCGETESRRLTQRIQLYHEMEEAVAEEKYEKAKEIRDQILKMESEAGIE
ncbi:MAG: UvrB/UvrC motif-containing protein [Thermoguttaceae bacterium]|nr:UvrB/UvrC motif-containing protein [Thermoguttaceae bacterium]MBR0193007.1 UvrB/UvrC motif-containing protein [Thermoguttaceae bacterium]MCR5164189.1 UvrB/UvrC motif-containing protein [Thermoguttaceae bacterium]